jgi:hypothetical protein
MRTVSLIYNTILAGKWYSAGEPIPENILTPNLRKYIVKPSSGKAKLCPRHLNFELNRPYSVDSEGYLRGSPGQQAAQMEAEIETEEEIVDELADAEVSEQVAAAIEGARQDYDVDIQRQKAEAQVKANRQEEAEDFVREEQDARVESGEWDQSETRRDPPERPARAASANSKLKVKGKRSFVRRKGRFVLANNVEVIEGEPLYRRRPKSFGVAERFIVFGKVRKETSND